MITATLTTDLTAAYDTVDNKISLDKLYHYGIRGKELELFENYFKNRKQYVQVDSFNSPIQEAPNIILHICE